jgi:uncharacterized protein YegL
MVQPARPGGRLASRPLHFIWIADCSGSMNSAGKIQALNNAIREALPQMRRVASENPNAEVFVRALAFSDRARWMAPQATLISNFNWEDLTASGHSQLGEALQELAKVLQVPPMEARALPPVLVLVSDGQATDDLDQGLAALLGQPWGARAVRLAIAIGSDADRDVLRRFIDNAAIRLLSATNPEDLVRFIHWTSTTVVKSASSPRAEASDSVPIALALPPPPPSSAAVGADDVVW